METNRIKWEESMLMRFLTTYGEISPKASKPAGIKEKAFPAYVTVPVSSVEASVVDEWKDFANDIDWAMM